MRNYKINWGKYLFFRWFVASWLLHGVHVLDKTEKSLRIVFELIFIFIPSIVLLLNGVDSIWSYLLLFGLVHTVFWLFASHWLVGYREVDKGFKGKGIQSIIDYLEYVKLQLMSQKTVVAIAVYGSLSRNKYHDRSDLDLRVLQEKPISLKLFFIITKLRFIGIWKYKIPLDLKLVDSIEYLKNEMRIDEKPIMIFKKYASFFNEGDDFTSLQAKPNLYLKNKE